METRRVSSPSVSNLSMIVLSCASCFSVKSSVFVSNGMLASVKILRLRERPTPLIDVSAASTLFLAGNTTPAILIMVINQGNQGQPWRCLCFLFLHTTRTTRFLRIMRHFWHMRRTEARTFIREIREVREIRLLGMSARMLLFFSGRRSVSRIAIRRLFPGGRSGFLELRDLLI